MFHLGRRFLVAWILIVLIGGAMACQTSVSTDPPALATPSGIKLTGRIEFEGGAQFLPRSLVATGSAEAGATSVFHYEYGTSYDHSSAAQILNPLLLLGFRGVGVDVTGTGTLEVVRPDGMAKTYNESCVVRMRRSVWIWGYPSESDLRQRALLCVRDLIDGRLSRDREFLDG